MRRRCLVPVGKSQTVRLADVFLIGPLMVWGGVVAGGVGGLVLAGLGAATVAYNGRNYVRVSRVCESRATLAPRRGRRRARP